MLPKEEAVPRARHRQEDGDYYLGGPAATASASLGRPSRLRMAALAIGLTVVVSALSGLSALTPPGRIVILATYHFLLFYAGALSLIALSAAVGAGLVATDRIIMRPGWRVVAQALHRAVAVASVVFLVVHIVTEVIAARSTVLDGFIPFLAHKKTLYIAEGTIGGDMMFILLWSG